MSVEGEATAPEPSDEAMEAARTEHHRARDAVQYFGASEDFSRSPVEAALTAAYAIDLPRLLAEARAEGEAARTAEIVAWLREHPVWSIGRPPVADDIAAQFGPTDTTGGER